MTYLNKSKLTLEHEQTKRKIEARSELVEFLKKLKKESNTITMAYNWYEFIEPLQSILRKYKDALPAETWQRLQDACKLDDETRGGIKTGIDILSLEIEKAIKVLPAKTRKKTSSAVIGLVIAVIVIGGVIAYLNLAAFQVAIRNNGCDPIQIPVAAPGWLTLFGLDLPERAIPTGESAIAKVPPLTVHIDATSRETIKLSIMGVDYYFERPLNVRSVTLDGDEVLDQNRSINLQESVIPEEKQSHELIITCNAG